MDVPGKRPRVARWSHAIMVLTVVTTTIVAPGGDVAAQTATRGGDPDRRAGVGLHVSWLRLGDLDATSLGLGGRATFDLSRWFGVEAEITAFPNDDFTIGNAASFVPEYTLTYRRSRISGFFGPRIGVRADRFGVFALARPGFTRLEGGDLECDGPGCAVILLAKPTYRPEFALDLGGAVELYFPSGASVRIDATDTIIRHRSQAPPCASCTTHNFTLRGGIGLRF